ncbi:hypothetical protein T4C_5459 [Trichinella pseudospiralis]|uniref:Uncharacterized protein n=1 Tax=Trichinella pseudospiralis TaxID=6337 RepID=A0A0V1JW58_TRIPS|nr:hypothetical protein T4C_5459 [Trichinella pseudospiralis]
MTPMHWCFGMTPLPYLYNKEKPIAYIPIACQQFQNGSCQQDVVSEVFMNTVTNHTAKYVSGKRDSYASRFIRTNRCRSDEEMPSQLR